MLESHANIYILLSGFGEASVNERGAAACMRTKHGAEQNNSTIILNKIYFMQKKLLLGIKCDK